MRSHSRTSRFLSSRAGNVAIISALLLPVLLGMAGLGTETAWWYSRQRELQGAADIAAFGGALVRRGGGSASDATTSATADAITNGWNQPIGTIVVSSPPTTGGYQNVQAVRVVLTENLSPLVSGIVFGNTTIPIRASSTATMRTGDPACILGLNTAASSTVKFWGNGSTSLFNCVVASNSTSTTGFQLGGSADLTAPCAYSSGGSSTDSGLMLTNCPAVVENHPATLDPYADVGVPPIGSCTSGASLPNSLSPGCRNGMDFGNGSTQLDPGIYVVNGGSLKMNANSVVNGTGVMFYLTNGATLDINGGATLNLSAATSGEWGGLLFFGSRTLPTGVVQKVNGDSTSNLTGAIYFPTQKVEFLGNFSGNSACLQIVADQVEYTGSATFQHVCAGTGVKDLTTVGNIKLVE